MSARLCFARACSHARFGKSKFGRLSGSTCSKACRVAPEHAFQHVDSDNLPNFDLPNLACEHAGAKYNLAFIDLDYRGRVDGERPNQRPAAGPDNRANHQRREPLPRPVLAYRPDRRPYLAQGGDNESYSHGAMIKFSGDFQAAPTRSPRSSSVEPASPNGGDSAGAPAPRL